MSEKLGKKKLKKGKIVEKKVEGITLIALVITIIVLLILAGVSISMLMGENGILNRSKEAREKTETATRKERTDLDRMNELIDETVSEEQTVEQVTDEYPGQLEEDGDEKVINSIEDLVFFAYDVTNGNNYEGKTVKLGLSLDFNSTKSYVEPYRIDYGQYGYNGELKTLLTSGEGFKSIGTNTNETGYESKSFSGTFDGNGKIIKNLYINLSLNDNTNDLVVGLFGSNLGIVKKIGIVNCNISGTLETNGSNTVIVGGISGRNKNDIEECFVYGNISSEGVGSAKSWIGGICGNCYIVKNCYNAATITCTGNSSNIAGGISGNSTNNGVINNCYNRGKINLVNVSSLGYIGGVLGCAGSSTLVKDCYNLGDIVASGRFDGGFYLGGVVGLGYGVSLNNCHNSCYIQSDVEIATENPWGKGLIIGYGASSGSLKCSSSNCSSLKFEDYNCWGEFDGDKGGLLVIKNQNEMPSILDVLGTNFKAGSNGHPILNWQ